MREHHLQISKTARFATLGEPGPAASVWFVLHGHAQLAALFLRHFEPLDDGTRYIVAPEALNRFYAEPTSWTGSGQARVGATWMTREDRLVEIEDYVRYLDTLHDLVAGQISSAARVTVLGFSQGVSTAARWVSRGRVRPHTLVLWAGPLPPELDKNAAAPLRALRLIRVLGDSDEMATPDAVAADARREAELDLASERITYGGGHKLDAGVLSALAARERAGSAS